LKFKEKFYKLELSLQEKEDSNLDLIKEMEEYKNNLEKERLKNKNAEKSFAYKESLL